LEKIRKIFIFFDTFKLVFLTLRLESYSPSIHGIEGLITFKHKGYVLKVFLDSNLFFNEFIQKFMKITGLVLLFEAFDNHFLSQISNT
jgi:hypothetical protein